MCGWNTVDENIIGASRKRNDYGAIKLLSFTKLQLDFSLLLLVKLSLLILYFSSSPSRVRKRGSYRYRDSGKSENYTESKTENKPWINERDWYNVGRPITKWGKRRKFQYCIIVLGAPIIFSQFIASRGEGKKLFIFSRFFNTKKIIFLF